MVVVGFWFAIRSKTQALNFAQNGQRYLGIDYRQPIILHSSLVTLRCSPFNPASPPNPVEVEVFLVVNEAFSL